MIIVLSVVAAGAWTVYYYARKIYTRRWLESFVDAAGIIPWPALLALVFFLLAALAKLWAPSSDVARRWGVAGVIVGLIALLLGWFLRAVLWAAPDAIWPENENTGKIDAPKPEPKPDAEPKK